MMPVYQYCQILSVHPVNFLKFMVDASVPFVISCSFEGRRLDELWMPQWPFRLGTFHGFHWSPLGSTQDGKCGCFLDFFKQVCK